MKTIEQIHRENLQALVDEYKSVGAVAEKIGCGSSQFSQWLNGSTNSGTGKKRGLRPASARRIEKACEKPSGWLDAEHQLVATELAPAINQQQMLYLWVSVDEAQLLTNYRTTHDTGRRMLIDMGNGLDKLIAPESARNE